MSEENEKVEQGHSGRFSFPSSLLFLFPPENFWKRKLQLEKKSLGTAASAASINTKVNTMAGAYGVPRTSKQEHCLPMRLPLHAGASCALLPRQRRSAAAQYNYRTSTCSNNCSTLVAPCQCTSEMHLFFYPSLSVSKRVRHSP